MLSNEYFLAKFRFDTANAFLVRRTQTARHFRVFGKIVHPMRAKKKKKSYWYKKKSYSWGKKKYFSM